MSCLTRKLQQQLVRYLKHHTELLQSVAPEDVRAKLVNEGLCPSDVTADQLHSMMKVASNQ